MAKATLKYRTGRFREALTTLRKRIAIYKLARHTFTIGITGSPIQRASRYGSQYGELIVLYKTSSERNIRLMEKILIEEYWEYCDNSVGGGGGPVGGPPYYLYIVR